MKQPIAVIPQKAYCLPVFLAPAFAQARPTASTCRSFSSTARQHKGKHPSKPNKDANKQRGVSALRSTGPRRETRVYRFPLPEPAKNPAAIPYEMNQEHGLYQFFNKARDAIIPPFEEDAHGRAWTEKELSKKDFYDLWKLHWTCVKEANAVATRTSERRRLKVGYGEKEMQDRLQEVRGTLKNIRKVLIQRHEDFSNGRILLENNDMVDLFPDAETSLGLRQDSDPALRMDEVDNTTGPLSVAPTHEKEVSPAR